ncbi:hypothetical protein SAMN05444166_5556 [Singulisphaera sp. GP187]|nr:hypothetical protein SAMN05444166_5556 [Singulisphaera sp. GP187]
MLPANALRMPTFAARENGFKKANAGAARLGKTTARRFAKMSLTLSRPDKVSPDLRAGDHSPTALASRPTPPIPARNLLQIQKLRRSTQKIPPRTDRMAHPLRLLT